MSKSSNIRWRSSDEQKLTREVQKFNAKITRELKKNPEAVEYLPSKINKAKLKAEITNRQDFNKQINKMERFMIKGVEKPITNKEGVTTTKWQRREMSIGVAVINRNRAVERARAGGMEAFTHGIPTGMTRALMGDERTDELKPKKLDFDKIKSKNEWQAFVESVEKQAKHSYNIEKMELFKKNYLTALETVFGDRALELISRLEMADARQIVDIFYGDEQASIDFIYDEAEASVKFDSILDAWENGIEGFWNSEE